MQIFNTAFKKDQRDQKSSFLANRSEKRRTTAVADGTGSDGRRLTNGAGN